MKVRVDVASHVNGRGLHYYSVKGLPGSLVGVRFRWEIVGNKLQLKEVRDVKGTKRGVAKVQAYAYSGHKYGQLLMSHDPAGLRHGYNSLELVYTADGWAGSVWQDATGSAIGYERKRTSVHSEYHVNPPKKRTSRKKVVAKPKRAYVRKKLTVWQRIKKVLFG